MVVILFLAGLLLKAIVSVVVALIEAIFFVWLMPYTGVPYDPTYWQGFWFCFLLNILMSWAHLNTEISK